MASVPPEHWHALPCEAPAPGATCPARIGDRDLLLCNVDGRVYAIVDRCSHANAPLARGRLVGHVLECPLHGGQLDVRDGSPVRGPIRKAVATFCVRERAGTLEISLESTDEETRNA